MDKMDAPAPSSADVKRSTAAADVESKGSVQPASTTSSGTGRARNKRKDPIAANQQPQQQQQKQQQQQAQRGGRSLDKADAFKRMNFLYQAAHLFIQPVPIALPGTAREPAGAVAASQLDAEVEHAAMDDRRQNRPVDNGQPHMIGLSRYFVDNMRKVGHKNVVRM